MPTLSLTRSFRPLALCLAVALLAVPTLPLPAAIYVRIPGVPGDVMTAGYNDGSWLAVERGTYGVNRSLFEFATAADAPLSIGIGELQPVHLTVYLNRAAAPLAQAAVSGNSVGNVEIHLVEPGGAGTAPFTFSIVHLSRVFVHSFHFLQGGTGPPGNPGGDGAWFAVELLYNEIEIVNRFLDASRPDGVADFVTAWDLITLSGEHTTETSENTAPTIESIGPLSIAEDALGRVSVFVTDPDGPAASLSVTATAENFVLLPDSGITVSGEGGERLLTLEPAPNGNGLTRVSVVVSDEFSSVSTEFELEVTPEPDPPFLPPIPPQLAQAGEPLVVLLLPSDPDQPPETLILEAISDNEALLPNASLVIAEEDGVGWTLTLTPTAGQSGTATVTIAVTDDTAQRGLKSFLVTVNSDGNTAPTDIELSPGMVPEDAPPGTLVGALSAIDPDAGDRVEFALVGDAGGLFTLVEGNQIVTSATASFDYETQPLHLILVHAIDLSGAVFGKILPVQIINLNEPPNVSLELPEWVPSGPFPISIPWPDLDFSDPDAGASEVTVILRVLHGTLFLNDSGVLFGKVANNGTRVVTVQAVLYDILQVLRASGLFYSANAGYDGADSLRAEIHDNGHTGAGDPQSATVVEPFMVRIEPFLAWLGGFFTLEEMLDPAIVGLLSDYDGDGRTTLMEYKLLGNPRDPTDGDLGIVLEEVEFEGEPYFEMTFVQRSDASDPHTVLSVLVADDLSGWSDAPKVVRLVLREALEGDRERIKVRAAGSSATDPTRFFRFRVEFWGWPGIP